MKWELQWEYLRLIDKIPQMWEDFARRRQNIYDRFGHLDAIVHDIAKSLNAAAQKKKRQKPHRIAIRLDDELHQLLQKYCRTKNISNQRRSAG